MNLKILLPTRVFADVKEVSCITAETRDGSFGLLPHRLDCVAALVPGILTYTAAGAQVYVAVDEGALIKTGAEVLVSVRRAIQGSDLRRLHEDVRGQFLALDALERGARTAVAKMEGAFIGRFAEFEHAGR